MTESRNQNHSINTYLKNSKASKSSTISSSHMEKLCRYHYVKFTVLVAICLFPFFDINTNCHYYVQQNHPCVLAPSATDLGKLILTPQFITIFFHDTGASEQ